MEEKIVKDGTKIILFALDTKDTSVTGRLWMANSCTNATIKNLTVISREKNFEVIPNKFINLTPHTITINNGTEYHPSGKVARVANKFSNFCCGISTVFYGEIENLPDIVSAMVLAAAKEKGRSRLYPKGRIHRFCTWICNSPPVNRSIVSADWSPIV